MFTKQLIQPRSGTTRLLGDQQIHILESGSQNGSPVVLLHGCGSLAEEVLIPFENGEFRLIAPDRPGYGFSTSLPTADRGPLGQSFWLERFLDASGLASVWIVAHSIGSASALHLAARRPDLVKALLLISPCCSPVRAKPLIVLRAASAPLVGGLIRRHVISRLATFFLDRGLRASSFPDTLPPHLAALPASHMVNPIAIETMADELRAFNRDMALLPNLPADMPIHVLFGSEDHIVDPAVHIDWLRQRHPAIVVKLLDGVGHLPHHVAPSVAQRMLSDLARTRALQITEQPFTDVA
ncbi:alpha/beta fold hydrolase [Rhizobium sp. BR 362]|uniref:alpha/beta fold hydrolase n=1 Tax=Rhizobium sp. BR 362 TaxID=3040670 RepID=UPI002F4222E8